MALQSNTSPDSIEWVKKILKLDSAISVTQIRSSEYNIVQKIDTEKGSYILKQGPNLKQESEKIFWLESKLPVPKLIGWRANNEDDFEELLMTCIEGEDLASLVGKISEDKMIEILVDALKRVHGVNIFDCPFGEKTKGNVLIHGDACLPNYILNNGELAGYIDLGGSRIDNVEKDLSAAVWSLNFNFNKELGIDFLNAYGISNPTKEYVDYLIEKYESDWAERFEDD